MAFRMVLLCWIKCQNSLHQILFAIIIDLRSKNQIQEENQIKAKIKIFEIMQSQKSNRLLQVPLSKDNASGRLIHDANMPINTCVNEFVEEKPYFTPSCILGM